MLEGIPSRIAAARVVEFAVGLSDVLLGVGRSEVDGDIDASVDGLGFLASVDREGSEPVVPRREVLFFLEFLVFDLRISFLLLVNHI